MPSTRFRVTGFLTPVLTMLLLAYGRTMCRTLGATMGLGCWHDTGSWIWVSIEFHGGSHRLSLDLEKLTLTNFLTPIHQVVNLTQSYCERER